MPGILVFPLYYQRFLAKTIDKKNKKEGRIFVKDA